MKPSSTCCVWYFLGPETLAGAGIADGFQQIGLTLGIVAHDQIHAGLKIQVKLLIIAEIPQLEIFKIHERSRSSDP